MLWVKKVCGTHCSKQNKTIPIISTESLSLLRENLIKLFLTFPLFFEPNFKVESRVLKILSFFHSTLAVCIEGKAAKYLTTNKIISRTTFAQYASSEVVVIVGVMLQASSGCDSDMEASPSREQGRNRSHHAGFGRGPGGAVRRRGTPIPVLPPRVPTPVPSSDTRYVTLCYDTEHFHVVFSCVKLMIWQVSN